MQSIKRKLRNLRKPRSMKTLKNPRMQHINQKKLRNQQINRKSKKKMLRNLQRAAQLLPAVTVPWRLRCSSRSSRMMLIFARSRTK
jgi:hypothetical protein